MSTHSGQLKSGQGELIVGSKQVGVQQANPEVHPNHRSQDLGHLPTVPSDVIFSAPLPPFFSNVSQDPALPFSIEGHGGSSPTMGITTKAALPEREDYLRRLMLGDVAPIFLISGASGSGKTHVAKKLEEFGVVPSERLITRQRRSADGPEDVSWSAESPVIKDPLIVSYGKYGDHYGFQRELILKALSGTSTSVIVGDAGKFLVFFEAIQNLAPLIPIVPLRVDVPLEIAAERMLQRPKAHSGESLIRDRINRRIDTWERLQLADIKRFSGLHTLLNLFPNEIERLNSKSNQVKPLTPEFLRELVNKFKLENQQHVKAICSDLLRPRVIDSAPEGVSEELFDALVNKLVPAADKHQLPVVIKGGLAVAFYLADAKKQGGVDNFPGLFDRNRVLLGCGSISQDVTRPVSPDIDFVIRTPEELSAVEQIFSELNAAPSAVRNYSEKPVFKSLKVSSAFEGLNGALIELDAIAMSRIKPDGSEFCFSFPYDEVIHFMHREVRLPNDAVAAVVPPEYLIVEKLTAARGAAMGKLDIFDSAILLATQPLRQSLLKRMIEMQSYSEAGFDSLTVKALQAPQSANETSLALRSLGISDPKLLEIVSARHGFQNQDSEDPFKFSEIEFVW